MNINFHIIVFVTTIIVYIFFRVSKDPNEYNKKSNLIFVLLTPIILYVGNYFYNKQHLHLQEYDVNSDIISDNNTSSDLLSVPYPQSTTDS